jgi:hypothetical protein
MVWGKKMPIPTPLGIAECTAVLKMFADPAEQTSINSTRNFWTNANNERRSIIVAKRQKKKASSRWFYLICNIY